jgi:hypothetical protein
MLPIDAPARQALEEIATFAAWRDQ